jgi:type I restriction enzyme S subunit
VIPEEWEVKSFAEIGHVKTGPFGTLLKAEEYYATEGAPLVSVRDIGEGTLTFDEHTPLVPPSVVRRLLEYVLNFGDIVFGRKGGVDRSAMVEESQAGCFLGSDGIRIRPSKACHAPFVAYQLQRKEIQTWLLQNATGTTMASMNQEILRRIALPFPPLPEQRAIAGALSDVDALIEALDRLIAKKRDLKQAAMQQLLTGQTRLPGFHGEWAVKRLGDCLLSRPDYGINAAAVPFSDKLPGYIRITDISEHGRFCPDPPVSVKAASADQFYLHAGDVVFARTGASVGKSYLYDLLDGRLVFAGFLIRVRPNPEVLVPAFLAAFAATRAYWNWVRLMSMRSGQPGINGDEYAQLPLSLPSVSEQTAIAEVLSDMDAELAALEQRRDKTRALKQGMMQELLTGRIRLISLRRI